MRSLKTEKTKKKPQDRYRLSDKRWRTVIQKRVCCTDVGRCNNLWLWFQKVDYYPSAAVHPDDAACDRPRDTFLYSFYCILHIYMVDCRYGFAYYKKNQFPITLSLVVLPVSSQRAGIAKAFGATDKLTLMRSFAGMSAQMYRQG